MFERETRREKILEAIDLNREMQLRQKNKDGFLNLLAGKSKNFLLVIVKSRKKKRSKLTHWLKPKKNFIGF